LSTTIRRTGHINVGSGSDVTIRETAHTVVSVVGYTGETKWDVTKPDGTPQKLLDVSKLKQAGWVSKISLYEGLNRTVAWYHANAGSLRGV
jgi:GDP-L-fucose synthase